jgi:hypothetical protein
MILCPQQKLAFLAVARTASKAMADALLRFVPDAYQATPPGDVPDPHHWVDPTILDGWDVIIGVRNPYARLYSMWVLSRRADEKSTEQFCDWLRAQDLSEHTVSYWTKGVAPTHIITFENAREGWAMLMGGLGLDQRLPFRTNNPTGVSTSFGWQLHYTDELARLVLGTFHDEFMEFGYDTLSWRMG